MPVIVCHSESLFGHYFPGFSLLFLFRTALYNKSHLVFHTKRALAPDKNRARFFWNSKYQKLFWSRPSKLREGASSLHRSLLKNVAQTEELSCEGPSWTSPKSISIILVPFILRGFKNAFYRTDWPPYSPLWPFSEMKNDFEVFWSDFTQNYALYVYKKYGAKLLSCLVFFWWPV